MPARSEADVGRNSVIAPDGSRGEKVILVATDQDQIELQIERCRRLAEERSLTTGSALANGTCFNERAASGRDITRVAFAALR